MAVTTGKKAATPVRKVASLNPEDMVAGGLASDFDGEITSADFRPYNYPKQDGTAMDYYVLTLHLDIEPDVASGYEPFEMYISAGSLDNHVPSLDGITPCPIHDDDSTPEDWIGYYAVQAGKKEQLGKDTKLGHWLRALSDAGLDPAILSEGDVRGLIGLYGHWDLIEYKSKGGNRGVSVDGGNDQKKRNDLLVVTEIKDKPKAVKAGSSKANGAAASAPTTTAKKAAPAAAVKSKAAAVVEPEDDDTATEEDAGNDLETRVTEVILEMLGEAGGTLATAKVAPKLMLALKAEGTATEALALLRVNGGAFLTASEVWSYDAASKSISL